MNIKYNLFYFKITNGFLYIWKLFCDLKFDKITFAMGVYRV